MVGLLAGLAPRSGASSLLSLASPGCAQQSHEGGALGVKFVEPAA
jgi:hypothetical protein